MEFFITSAGIPVHINESKKDGTAILLLHGYLETLYVWEEFINLLPASYRIISIDLPGHGLSGIPNDGLSSSFCIQFFRQLFEKLSVGYCHFITHTCGFFLARPFISSSSERILSLTNIDSSLNPGEKEKNFIADVNKSISDGCFMKFVSSYIPKSYDILNLRAFDEKIEETIENCETHDPIAISVFFKTISELFSSDGPHSIPVMNICGQNNPFTSPVPSDYHVIPDSGMNSFIESPDAVSEIISAILHQ